MLPFACNGDETVRINELVTAVTVALGSGQLAVCEESDVDGDGQVTISELVQAVNSAIAGCTLLPAGESRDG